MPNIGITHADSGLVRTRVARSERVTPHMQRVTLSGEDLDSFVPSASTSGSGWRFQSATPTGSTRSPRSSTSAP